MKTQATDRRMKRTDKALCDALVALIQVKHYDAITIQDILERANVGRSTFYAHYYDKEDLLVSVLEGLLQGLGHTLVQESKNTGELFPSLQFFRHVQERQDLYKAMAWGRGLQTFEKNLRAYLTQQIQAQLSADKPSDGSVAVSPNLLATFVADTFLCVIKWWLDNKMPYSPEQIDDIFRQLTTPGLKASQRE